MRAGGAVPGPRNLAGRTMGGPPVPGSRPRPEAQPEGPGHAGRQRNWKDER